MRVGWIVGLMACRGAFDPELPEPEVDTCSVEQPDGPCPGDRVCVAGACILDVDPREPPPSEADRLAAWEAIGAAVQADYAAFDAKPDLDWSDVRARVRERVRLASTRLDWITEMSRGVAEIGDGHTYLFDPSCRDLDLPARGFSNIGACFVEGDDGAILLNRVAPDARMDVRPGDQLLAVDGRPVERMIEDIGEEQVCVYVGSTPAMTRADRVQTLGWRRPAEGTVTVRRIDGTIEDVAVELADRALRCDGRVPPAGVVERAGGLSWARLDGDIGYLYFPFFGAFDAQGRLQAEPLQSEIRAVLEENRDVRALVLDLRANGGGYPSIYFDLASWLYDEPTVLFYGTVRGGTPSPLVIEPDPTLQLPVPVAVLVSARSFSAADFSSSFLIQTGRARSFGQPSGGGFGSSGAVFTTGTTVVGINNYAAFDLDLNPLEGRPPPVAVPLRPRAADLAAGRDTEIEAALAWIATQR